MKRHLERLDRLQQRFPFLSLPIAVFKRFGEHGGGRLVTTISYWSFFSIFPLLLVFVAILDTVLEDNPELRQDLLDSALGQVPVIGTQLAESQTRWRAAGSRSRSARPPRCGRDSAPRTRFRPRSRRSGTPRCSSAPTVRSSAPDRVAFLLILAAPVDDVDDTRSTPRRSSTPAP